MEWRFRKAAFSHLGRNWIGASSEMEPIVFNDVFPLYACSDIRGSSNQRNDAIQADLSEHLSKLTDKLATQAVADAKKESGAELARTLASRRAAGTMLQLIASAYGDAMALAAGADRPAVHADQLPAIRAIAERFEPAELAEIVESLSRYEQLLWRNVNAKTVWDNVVITCASAAPLRI